MDEKTALEWAKEMERLGYFIDRCPVLIGDEVCNGPALSTEDGLQCFSCGYQSPVEAGPDRVVSYLGRDVVVNDIGEII